MITTYLSAGDDEFDAYWFEAATVYGLNGDDFIAGSAYDDWLYGGRDSDQINGSYGDDHIYGGAGVDYLSDEHGSDTLHGGDGHDGLSVSNGELLNDGTTDQVFGGNGNDSIASTSYAAMLHGGKGSDSITSWAGDAYIFAGDGNDIVLSVGGIVYGNRGNDLIANGSSDDREVVYANGGLGRDTFVQEGQYYHHSPLVITDFSAGDKIRLTGYDSSGYVQGAAMLDKDGSGTLTVADGWDGVNGVFLGGGPTGIALNAQIDGTFVQVWGVDALNVSDFVL